MNDWFDEASRWAYGIFITAVGAMGWWVKRQISRLDNHEDRLEAIEQDYARREDIDRVLVAIKESEKHTGQRIDRVYERLSK